MSAVVLFICILLRSSIEAARILAVFPTASISHQVVFRPITTELARRGHDVVVITTDPAFPYGTTPENLSEIDLHDISYSIWEDNFKKKFQEQQNSLQQINIILQLKTIMLETYLKHEEIINLIKTRKFDLVLVEALFPTVLIFSHIFKTPAIMISSLGGSFDNYEALGVPSHPILYPTMFHRRINNINWWEKIAAVYIYYMYNKKDREREEINNAILKKYLGENTPTVSELLNNVDMLFLNVNPIFEGIRPVPPNVVYLGGLHQKPEQNLTKDLQSYLDSSKQGVIYISFGTNVVPSMLPPERIQAIVKVLSELPYNVLWKYDKDELPGKSDNIKIGKWFPQADLLRHPNVKLFVTQGGLQSTDEAITAGVPLIGVPVIGDQWFNTEKYVYHKIGVKLDMEILDYDIFKAAVKTVIDDESGYSTYSYRRNIVRLRELMLDEPMKPLDRAIWWTEYVLRHGGAKHLRSPSANISWAQYLELELVLAVLAGLLLALTLVIGILYFVIKSILSVISPATPKKKIS